jgi:voltage-gated potassium channel
MASGDSRRPSWPTGSRVRRLHASHSYRFVLFLILATCGFVMAAPDEQWALGVLALLLCATLVVAIWTSGLGWNLPRTTTLVTGGVVLAVLVETVGGNGVTGVTWLIGLGLTASIMWMIGLGVIDQGEVNGQSIVGAVCIYMLLGLSFSFAYGALAKFGPGYVFAQGTDGTPAIRLYFSYITMATVGYGDYSPAGNLGRTLAVLEGLFGQLYLVTVISLLVSRLRPRRSRDSE